MSKTNTEQSVVSILDMGWGPSSKQATAREMWRTALANNDHAGCWARVVPCQTKPPYPFITPGDICPSFVRLTAVNGSYYSFIGFFKGLHGVGGMKAPEYYLLHESDFTIVWVREGQSVETAVHGNDLERDWRLGHFNVKQEEMKE